MLDSAHLKNLEKIDKCLKKTIIVDNLPQNFKLQKQNGIKIDSWYGDMQDTSLYSLYIMLKELVISEPDDVREYLQKQFKNTQKLGFSVA